MHLHVNKYSEQTDTFTGLKVLQQQLLRFSFLNLFLVALAGLALRSYPFAHIPFDYRNLVHGHSHFAFGGWIMPLLIWMIMEYFPKLTGKIAFHHWRNIVWATLISAYGMLASFPFQGYGPVSIIFSTLSVLAGFYFALLVWQASAEERQKVPVKFLRAGLFYLVLSSLGPFAIGPITAMGRAGTPLYYNAIYFYLHFQYNGWFSFVVLAVLMKVMEQKNGALHGNKIFTLFNLACAPSFFLSVLWIQPATIFYIVGALAALIQLAAVFILLAGFRKLNTGNTFVQFLFRFGVLALVVKTGLQLLSSFPFVAELAFQTKNIIIAYLHLALLGFISVFGFAFVLNSERKLLNIQMRTAIMIFLFSFVSTGALLVVQPMAAWFHFSIPFYQLIIFICSCFFPVACLLMSMNVRRFLQTRYFSRHHLLINKSIRKFTP